MTKKHFIQFAKLVAKHKQNISNEFLRDLISIFIINNNRFDENKFLDFVIKEVKNN